MHLGVLHGWDHNDPAKSPEEMNAIHMHGAGFVAVNYEGDPPENNGKLSVSEWLDAYGPVHMIFASDIVMEVDSSMVRREDSGNVIAEGPSILEMRVNNPKPFVVPGTPLGIRHDLGIRHGRNSAHESAFIVYLGDGNEHYIAIMETGSTVHQDADFYYLGSIEGYHFVARAHVVPSTEQP